MGVARLAAPPAGCSPSTADTPANTLSWSASVITADSGSTQWRAATSRERASDV